MLWQGLGEGYALAGPRSRFMLWQGLGEGYALAVSR